MATHMTGKQSLVYRGRSMVGLGQLQTSTTEQRRTLRTIHDYTGSWNLCQMSQKNYPTNAICVTSPVSNMLFTRKSTVGVRYFVLSIHFLPVLSMIHRCWNTNHVQITLKHIERCSNVIKSMNKVSVLCTQAGYTECICWPVICQEKK